MQSQKKIADSSLKTLSMHHHIVLSSILLTKKLIDENKADFSALNEEGKTPLRILASSAWLNGYLETLDYILKNVADLNVNQGSPFGGWTALHEAFAKNKGYGNFYDDHIEDQKVAKNKFTLAIDLLIAHGAEPLKDKALRTPLMCLTFNDDSSSYNRRVIERYFRFEAQYYGIEPEVYKKELYNLRSKGFKQIQTPGVLGLFGCETAVPKIKAVKQFWKNLEAAKNPLQKHNFSPR